MVTFNMLYLTPYINLWNPLVCAYNLFVYFFIFKVFKYFTNYVLIINFFKIGPKIMKSARKVYHEIYIKNGRFITRV